MAILTVQKILKTGVVPTWAAAAGGGDSFPNTGLEFLEVVNASGAPITVTIPVQTPCSWGSADHTAHDIIVSVTNGTTKRIGPIRPGEYNDANGLAQITYSEVTSLTVGVFVNGPQ